MKDLLPLLIFLGMILLFPLLFVLAYFLWDINHILALVVLLIGLSADLVGGLEILDRILNRT